MTIKGTAVLAAGVFLLGGCVGDGDAAPGSEGGAGGAPIADGQGGGEEVVIPWDGSPYLGFGYDGAPCSATSAFVEREPLAGSSLASTPIAVPVNGFITRVTVVHAVQSSIVNCTIGARRVLVSEPTSGAVPVSPGVREEQLWTETQVSDAALYPMADAQKSKTVRLERDLSEPLYVTAGQYVHIASALEDPTTCALACGRLLDGSEPPTGHAHCTVAETWEGCGPMPDPGATSHIAYVAWVDFAAE